MKNLDEIISAQFTRGDLLALFKRRRTRRAFYELLMLFPQWREFIKRFKATFLILLCAQCGRRDQIWHVHHKKYRDRSDYFLPWESPFSDMLLLCEDCHGDTHRKPRKTIRESNENSLLSELAVNAGLRQDIMKLSVSLAVAAPSYQVLSSEDNVYRSLRARYTLLTLVLMLTVGRVFSGRVSWTGMHSEIVAFGLDPKDVMAGIKASLDELNWIKQRYTFTKLTSEEMSAVVASYFSTARKGK